jgi:hypothetical protein
MRKDWQSVYEAARTRLDMQEMALSGSAAQATAPSGHEADFLMPFAARFMRREISGNASAPAPEAQRLTKGEGIACKIIHDTLRAKIGDEIELMCDYPRVGEAIYMLYKFRDKADPSMTRLDDTCRAALSAGMGGMENLLSRAVLILRAYAEVEAHQTAQADPGFQIETTDPGFLDWLGQDPDPDLWHQMLCVLNYDIKENVEVLHWIIRQPACDRATAATIFMMLNGADIVGFSVAAVQGHFPGPLIADLCQRANAQGFIRHELSLSSVGWPNDQSAALPQMQRAYDQRAQPGIDCVPVPTGLFITPLLGRAPASPYVAHSECVISLG